MRRKYYIVAAAFALVTVAVCAALSDTGAPGFRITGLVRQPLALSLDDLSRYQTVAIRYNDVGLDGTYRGAHLYRAVPLKYLLEQADIKKDGPEFSKSVDLAIVVRGRKGEKAVLSWGEVMYRNAGDAVIAFSVRPVMPSKTCTSCHKSAGEYEKWLTPMTRTVSLPRLVMAGDYYGDRCVEGVSTIEVVCPRASGKSRKGGDISSDSISVGGEGVKPMTIDSLSAYRSSDVSAKSIGDGKGYHGNVHYIGSYLVEICKAAGVMPGIDSVLVVTSPDGYQSLLSWGEVLLTAQGKNIMLADRIDAQPIRKMGRFHLVVPDDLSADRWVKAVSGIEIVRIK